MHNRLKKIRIKQGMKQSYVCAGIVSASHYSNIEACRHTPSVDTIKLLAKRIGVPAGYLLNTRSHNSDLEKVLSDYERLIELRDRNGIKQLLYKHNYELQYIESIAQEFHYNLLKFLELSMSNQIKDAADNYEENISSFDTSNLNVNVYKRSLYVSGLYNYYKRNYKESIKFYLMTIDLDKNFKSRLYYNISLCFNAQKIYNDALYYAKAAKELYLKEHEWHKVGDCYNLISVILREMNNLSESESYIKKNFDIAGDTSIGLKAKLFHNLSLVYRDQGDTVNALKCIDESINLKTKIKLNDLFISYRVKLNIFLETQDLTNIEQTLVSAEKYVTTQLELAHIKFIKSQLEWMICNYEKYEKLISASIQLFLDLKDWKSLQLASEHFSLYLEKNYKYKKALELQKLSNLALKNCNRGESGEKIT